MAIGIWISICLHLLWGVLLLIDPSPQNVTSIYWVSWLLAQVVGVDEIDHVTEGLIMLVVAGLALVSVFERQPTLGGLVCVIWQQVVLMLSATGAIIAIATSQFADGVVRPWPFIAADQCYPIMIAIGHTIAVIHQYSRGLVLQWLPMIWDD